MDALHTADWGGEFSAELVVVVACAVRASLYCLGAGLGVVTKIKASVALLDSLSGFLREFEGVFKTDPVENCLVGCHWVGEVLDEQREGLPHFDQVLVCPHHFGDSIKHSMVFRDKVMGVDLRVGFEGSWYPMYNNGVNLALQG